MIEAYKVGVTLALDASTVTAGLTKVSGQFEALNRVVKSVQGSVNNLAGAMQGLSGIGTAAARAWQDAANAMDRAARSARSAGTGAAPQSLVRLQPPSTGFTLPGGPLPSGGASYPRGPMGGALATLPSGGAFAGGAGTGGALAPYAEPGRGPIPLNYSAGRPMPSQHEFLAAGAGFGVLGEALSGLVKGAVDARAEIDHLGAQLGRMGMSSEEVARAQQNAVSIQQGVAGVTQAQALELQKDLMAVTQNKEDALNKDLVTSWAQAAVVLAASGKKDAIHELFTAMQAGELRGAFSGADGKPDPQKASNFLQSVLATTLQSGGRYGPNEILQTIKSGGLGAAMIDDRALFADMIAPVLSLGPARAGTGIQALASQLTAGKMSEAAVMLMLRMGLIENLPADAGQTPGQQFAWLKPRYKTGIGVWSLPQGMMPYRDNPELNPGQHPIEFMDKVLLPRLDAYNLRTNGAPRDDADLNQQRMALALQLAARIPTGNIVGDVIRNMPLILRDRKAISEANERGANNGAFNQFIAQDPEARTKAFSAALNGLEVALGGPIMDSALGALKDLTTALNFVSTWASAHPDATRRLMETTAAVAAFSLAMAALSGVFVVAAPMFTVLRWLPGGITALAASTSALSAAAPGTVAASLGGLAAAIGVLGKAALAGMAADQALKAVDPNDRMGSWIDRHIPGAAAVDDFAARHLGLGRTYQQQQDADPTYRPQSFVPPAGAGGGAPIHVSMNMDGERVARLVLDRGGRIMDRPQYGQVAFDRSLWPRFGGASFALRKSDVRLALAPSPSCLRHRDRRPRPAPNPRRHAERDVRHPARPARGSARRRARPRRVQRRADAAPVVPAGAVRGGACCDGAAERCGPVSVRRSGFAAGLPGDPWGAMMVERPAFIPLISLEAGAAERLIEHCFNEALTLFRDRILDGRLELCVAADVPMNGTHDAIFRLQLIP